MTNLDLARAVAQAAGDFLVTRFNKKKVDWQLKQRHEIVTKADTGSEKIILGWFKKYTPAFSVLSEESGFNKIKSDYLWVVDPLDGTTNFRVHNPLFSVSIALYYKRQPLVGVVYVPYLKETYSAVKGRGAFLNGRRLKVSMTKNIKKSFLTYCHGSESKHVKQAVELYKYFKLNSIDMRQLGSAAIELAWVAAGRVESLVIPGCKPWDAAAGILLVREAGGRVTDFNNKEWSIYDKSNKVLSNIDLLATNGKIHQVILNKL